MNVLFFTGAGISKDSGVPTFQEIDGIRTKLRRKYAAFVLVKLFGNTLFGNHALYRNSIGVI